MGDGWWEEVAGGRRWLMGGGGWWDRVADGRYLEASLS